MLLVKWARTLLIITNTLQLRPPMKYSHMQRRKSQSVCLIVTKPSCRRCHRFFMCFNYDCETDDRRFVLLDRAAAATIHSVITVFPFCLQRSLLGCFFSSRLKRQGRYLKIQAMFIVSTTQYTAHWNAGSHSPPPVVHCRNRYQHIYIYQKYKVWSKKSTEI